MSTIIDWALRVICVGSAAMLVVAIAAKLWERRQRRKLLAAIYARRR